MAVVIHVIEESVGGEVGWKGRKRTRKSGGKAGLSTRPDNGDPQETAEEDFPRCRTGALALESTNAHTHTYICIFGTPPPPPQSHKKGHPPTVKQQCPLSRKSSLASTLNQCFKLIGRSVSMSSLSPVLAAPALAGHRASSHPRLVIG